MEEDSPIVAEENVAAPQIPNRPNFHSRQVSFSDYDAKVGNVTPKGASNINLLQALGAGHNTVDMADNCCSNRRTVSALSVEVGGDEYSYRRFVSRPQEQSAADLHRPVSRSFQNLVHHMQAQRTAQRKMLQGLSVTSNPSLTRATAELDSDSAGSSATALSVVGPDHKPPESSLFLPTLPASSHTDRSTADANFDADAADTSTSSPPDTRQAERAQQLIDKMSRMRVDARTRAGVQAGRQGTERTDVVAAAIAANTAAVGDYPGGASPGGTGTVLGVPIETSAPVPAPLSLVAPAVQTPAVTAATPVTPAPRSKIPRRVKSEGRPARHVVSSYSMIGISGGGSLGGDTGGCADGPTVGRQKGREELSGSEEGESPASAPFTSLVIPGAGTLRPELDPEERPLRPMAAASDDTVAVEQAAVNNSVSGGDGGGTRSHTGEAAPSPTDYAVTTPSPVADCEDGPEIVEVVASKGCNCIVS